MTNRPGVSFVLPMYNEAANIAHAVEVIGALAREIADDYEIVVVDDASTDGSGQIADRLSRADPRVKSVRLRRNTKFGGALKEGLARSTKEVVIYTDADLPVEEHDVKKALELLGEADVVTGYSLVLKDASLKRIIMSKGYNFLVHLFFGLNLHDVNSGFKIYKRKVLEGLAPISMSPFVDVEIFCEARKRGYSIEQYGLVFRLRTKGKSTISRFPVVARTFFDMLVYRFSK